MKAVKGENCIFLDIATIKKVKDGPLVSKPNWWIMVDERTGMKFSDFYALKVAMVEPTCKQWHQWRTVGLEVKIANLIMLEKTSGYNKGVIVSSGNWMLNSNSQHETHCSRIILQSWALRSWQTEEGHS